MNELQLQRYTIDVVQERGGAAQKLSHRFNLGVSDLLIKLPPWAPGRRISEPRVAGQLAMLIEVKQHRGVPASVRPFTLDVTRPQENFLKRFQAAGMRVGVLSFLQGPRGKLDLCAKLFELDKLVRDKYAVRPVDHVVLGRFKETQAELLYTLLENFARGNNG